MPSFVTVTSGATAQAQDVNQLINAMNGTAGQGVPISLTALNDSVNFALAVKNADPTNSRTLQVLRSNNNVLLQADASGVIVSPDGGASTAQVVNTTLAQTLTNKTLGATNSIATAALAANAVTQDGLATAGVDFTTVSTTFVDVTGLSVTLTTTGGDVLVWTSVPLAIASGSAYLAFNQDGADTSALATTTSTVSTSVGMVYRFATPAAGAHTYKVRARSSAGGTVTMAMAAAVNGNLLAVELKR